MISIHTLGGNVNKFRKEQGMNIQEFALNCGLSVPYMFAIEKGEGEIPVDHVEILATALGKTTEELLTSSN